ncbi:MAG: hypothetical protein VYC17_02725 [Nitrospinota bacterium]|nr:hypothetical protein [Nitrospinota bacterium]
MFDLSLKKIGHGINYAQYKMGAFCFPLLEPIFRWLENHDGEIRRHIEQTETSLENNDLNVALLNLNKVLSLRPKHFLARLYRGRIHIHQNQFRLAAEDYALASEISRYRFIHYDLYREYFSSLNKGTEPLNVPIAKDFSQAFKMLQLDKESFANDPDLASESSPVFFSELMNEEENLEEDKFFTEQERSKFSQLKPITRQEIQETDWARLMKKLTSRPKDP